MKQFSALIVLALCLSVAGAFVALAEEPEDNISVPVEIVETTAEAQTPSQSQSSDPRKPIESLLNSKNVERTKESAEVARHNEMMSVLYAILAELKKR